MPACPICNTEMQHADHSGVPIDVCPEHGIWLDKEELLKITESARHDEGPFLFADLFRSEVVPPRQDDRVLSCPHCGKDMKHEVYQQVEMDWCPDHGVFLDKGELEAILNNLRTKQDYLRGIGLRLWEKRY